MAIRIVRLGSPRLRNEGLRLGTARRLPRGVRKADYAELNFFDLWFPELAPSEALLRFAHAAPLGDKRWAQFAARYRREMSKPQAARLLELLARLSERANFSVGCYCADEARCHRSVLRELLAERGASIASPAARKTARA